MVEQEATTRADGYYWVRINGEDPEIAHHNPEMNHWSVIGQELSFAEDGDRWHVIILLSA